MKETPSKSVANPKSAATPATKIGLIGSGSWATALAKILHETGQEFNWYFRFRSQIRAFKKQGHNPNYLTSVSFDTSKIHFYSDLTKLVEESDTLLLCTPSPYLKGILQKVEPEKYKGRSSSMPSRASSLTAISWYQTSYLRSLIYRCPRSPSSLVPPTLRRWQ